MVRTAVTILVGLQMLMPTGMCICRFAAAAAPRAELTASASHVGRSCCSSCGSRQHTRDGCPVTKTSGQADPDTCPAPPRDHLPGCPAVAPDVSAKLPVSSDPPVHEALTALASAPAVDTLDIPNSVAQPAPLRPSHSGRPLYVTFCSLRN